jgi:hypothetical protein
LLLLLLLVELLKLRLLLPDHMEQSILEGTSV